MLWLLINWTYILFITYCIGYGFLSILKHITNTSYRIRTDACFASGLGISLAYAQLFSLFYKVGFMANLILIILSVIFIITYKKNILSPLLDTIHKYLHTRIFTKSNHSVVSDRLLGFIRILFALCVYAFFLYTTSYSDIHYDTALYHAQSIHWIEDYGVVKGLGLLHKRFAYNSSYFCLAALFSFAWVPGCNQSLHGTSGLIAMLMFFYAISFNQFTRKSQNSSFILLSDICKIALLGYIFLSHSMITSPTSDYGVHYCIFYIIISWITHLEHDEREPLPYALLSVLSVIALTIKLSAGALCILVIWPAILLIKNKNYKDIIIYVVLGLLSVLPFLIRNYIIGGWLLFPFAGIDLFNVPWKIDRNVVITDANEVKVWAIGTRDMATANEPFYKWIPQWFGMQATSDKLLILTDLLSIILLPINACISFIQKNNSKMNYLLVHLAVTLCGTLWLLSAPMIRYGYSILLLLCGFTLYNLLNVVFGRAKFTPDNKVISTLLVAAIILIPIPAAHNSLFWYFVNGIKLYPLHQIDYVECPYDSVELGNTTIYYPTEGDQIGYWQFPSTPYPSMLEDVVIIDDDIKSGFEYK